MGQAVPSQAYWSSVDGRSKLYSSRRKANRRVCIRSHNDTLSSQIAGLGMIIAILQILDGFLTGYGMFHFGTGMEGNAVLRSLMHSIGYIPALVLVKTTAVAVVSGLCIYAWRITWLKHAFRAVIALYVVCAIIPWSLILISHLTA